VSDLLQKKEARTRETILEELNMIIEERAGMKLDPGVNFLQIGGDSISAAQIVAQVNQYFDIDLQPNILLESTTIAEFLEIVAQELLHRGVGIPVDLGKNHLEPAGQTLGKKKWALTPNQLRVWKLDRIHPGNPAFNIAAAIKIKGKLQAEVLNKSCNDLISRHDLLRSRIIIENDTVYQSIEDETPALVPIEEINESEIQTKLQEESARPFNILEENLFRIKVFGMNGAEQVLFFNIHHIIADDQSLRIIMEDFLNIYSMLAGSKDTSIKVLRSKYHDFVEYQKKIMDQKHETLTAYWKDNLQNVPTKINLPYDFERPETLTYKAGNIHFKLDQGIVQSVKKISVDSKITIFNFLYSAFSCLLFIAGNQKEFLVGCPIENRKLPEFKKVVGFFTNTLIMKNRFSDDLEIMNLMKQNLNISSSAFANSDIPFMSIVQDTGVPEKNNIYPLCQVMFGIQPADVYPAVDNYSCENLILAPGYSVYDIFLAMKLNDDSISGAFNYSMDLFREKTAGLLVSGFISVIQQIVQNPDLKIKELHAAYPSIHHFK
jgi:acyl carrier protein